ncbi:hypothetical protein COO60DRAFT_690086 [Scenedesmus sp. NREL 46B-D3]|nr:hypothetical protein COO60DRAFT_690086 [Scenedesmus sp. NREL 46B-D3]
MLPSASAAAAASIQYCSRVACAALLRQPVVPAAPWAPQISQLKMLLTTSQTASGSNWRCCSSRSSSSTHHQPHNHEQQHNQQQYLDETNFYEDGSEQPMDKHQMLRELLRKAHVAEAAMANVLAGQQLVLRHRPDAAFFAEQERDALHTVQQLMPRYRVRPSALLSVLQGVGLAAGAAAALAPAAARNAVLGALQESLTGLYNDQLRAMREAGLSDEAQDVRAVMIKLRNLDRADEASPAPPDIVSLTQAQSLADVGATGVLGAVVKAAADAAVAASGKV